jgi:hypothetical protein
MAAFVVFVIHPGGFEGQVGWFFFACRLDSCGSALGLRLQAGTKGGTCLLLGANYQFQLRLVLGNQLSHD